MSHEETQAIINEIKINPHDPFNWLVLGDSLEDTDQPVRATMARSMGTALQNGKLDPIDALPHLRAFFAPNAETPLDTTTANPNYADYLIVAGGITGNRLTSLQGEYMADYLQRPNQPNINLLNQIRTEAHNSLHISEHNYEQIATRIIASRGTIDFNFDNVETVRLPMGFHASGKFSADRYNATALEDGFHAGGRAHFLYCPQLASTGKGFYCGGEAAFSQSTQLTTLGEGLNVQTLLLNGTRVADFPADITVRGAIYDIPGPDCFTNANLEKAFHHCPNLSHTATECLRMTATARGFQLGGK